MKCRAEFCDEDARRRGATRMREVADGRAHRRPRAPYLENGWTSMPCVCVCVACARLGHSIRWETTRQNGRSPMSMISPTSRSASDRVGAPFPFSAMPRCRFSLLLAHSLSLSPSHTLSLSHTLSRSRSPSRAFYPFIVSLLVTLRKKSVLVYNTRSRFSVSRSVSATRDLRSACSILKSRLMHCVECERRLLLVRLYTIRTMKERR